MANPISDLLKRVRRDLYGDKAQRAGPRPGVGSRVRRINDVLEERSSAAEGHARGKLSGGGGGAAASEAGKQRLQQGRRQAAAENVPNPRGAYAGKASTESEPEQRYRDRKFPQGHPSHKPPLAPRVEAAHDRHDRYLRSQYRAGYGVGHSSTPEEHAELSEEANSRTRRNVGMPRPPDFHEGREQGQRDRLAGRQPRNPPGQRQDVYYGD